MTLALDIELSSSSIDKALKQLNAYINDLPRKDEEIEFALCEEGVENAVQNIEMFDPPLGDWSTGELAESIHTEKTADGHDVVAGTDHAKFVEFGTGVKGLKNGYPYSNDAYAGWNTGETIEGEGHFEYHGMDAWSPFSGLITSGMPSRPYMAPAALYMRSMVSQVAKEVFSR